LKAFENLFKELSKPLYCFAVKLVHDHEKSEEIVHDTFIKLWECRKKIQIKTSLKAYLYRSVHNASVNWLVKSRTHNEKASLLVDDEAWIKIINTCECNAFLIELLEADQTEKTINEIIKELPDRCRQIFIMSRFDNRTVKEISDILNISQSSVKTQLSIALERLSSGIKKNNL